MKVHFRLFNQNNFRKTKFYIEDQTIMDWNDYGLESAKPDLQSTFNDYGLESAKPDLQSTFKKPGGDTAAP